MDLYYNGEKIQDIVYNEADGLNFEEIGYTEAPEYLQKGFDYAKEIKEGWDSRETTLYNMFKDDTKLVFMPMIDTSKVDNMGFCFDGCSSLITIPELDTGKVTFMLGCFDGCSKLTTIPLLDTSNVTNMGSCFSNCSSLTTIPKLNTSNVTSMFSCFSGCSSLTTIPELDTSNVTDMRSCFSNCSSLTTIPELDTSNVTNMQNCFSNALSSKLKRVEGISFKSMGRTTAGSFLFGYSGNTSLRYLLIKDIGTNSACTTIDASYARVWGINSEDVPDARQSLIDSLLTYSFDRRTAGYSDCTIKLYADVKAVLTEDEITQIQAKGYIIS